MRGRNRRIPGSDFVLRDPGSAYELAGLQAARIPTTNNDEPEQRQQTQQQQQQQQRYVLPLANPTTLTLTLAPIPNATGLVPPLRCCRGQNQHPWRELVLKRISRVSGVAWSPELLGKVRELRCYLEFVHVNHSSRRRGK